MEFITAKDIPNGGRYGESDSSWKRSYIKSITKYNSDGQIAEKTTNEYAMQSGRMASGAIYNVFAGIDLQEPLNMEQSTYGIVNVKKITRTVNGVTTVQNLKMAPDLEGEDLDTTSFIAPRYFKNMRTYRVREEDEWKAAEGMECAVIDGFGDANKKDFLVTMGMNTKYSQSSYAGCQIYVWVAPDIEYTDTYSPQWRKSLFHAGRCPEESFEHASFCIGSELFGTTEGEMIGGMTVSDFNGNGMPDLIVAGLDHINNGLWKWGIHLNTPGFFQEIFVSKSPIRYRTNLNCLLQ
jgi:hypothetical protein